MRPQRLWRSITGLIVSSLLFCGPPVYAQGSYPYNAGSSGSGYPTRSYDPYDPYTPVPQAGSSRGAPQSSRGYGAPFGLNQSAAGAITGALMGAASGAIIGSHKGKAGEGAAIGAGLGAVSGYLVGRQLEGRDRTLAEQQQLIEQQHQEIARNRALLEELKRRNLDVRETERGVVVNLPDVLFAFNSARLTATAHSHVAHIATVLDRRARNRRVSVEGHTDSIGSESYNLVLSQRRAEAVAEELIYDGVQATRITTRGYGEKYPVTPNIHSDGLDNPAGRVKNRRVEVVIEN